jgi:hypothetical protein
MTNAITAASLTITRAASTNKPAWSRTVYNGSQVANERNDCVVRAMMTVTGSTYKAAHDLLRTRCNRRNRKGTPARPLIALLDSGSTLGAKFERVVGRPGQYIGGTRSMTLAAFIRSNPVGVFFVWKRGHAFAIVDGVLVDTWHVGSRSRVCCAWRVTVAKRATKRTGTKRGSKYTALLTTLFADYAVDGVATVPVADLLARGFAMSTTKYHADWGNTMPCGRAAEALGLSGKLNTREGVVVITRA